MTSFLRSLCVASGSQTLAYILVHWHISAVTRCPVSHVQAVNV